MCRKGSGQRDDILRHVSRQEVRRDMEPAQGWRRDCQKNRRITQCGVTKHKAESQVGSEP